MIDTNKTDPFLAEVNQRRKLRVGRQDTFSISAVVLTLVIGSALEGAYKLLCFPILSIVALLGPVLFPVADESTEIRCPRCQEIPSIRQRTTFKQCANCFYPNEPSAYWKETDATDDVIGDQWRK